MFRTVPDEERLQIRRELGVGPGPLLLTVKRLHEVAGYPDLLSTMPTIIGGSPQTTLWIVGEGELRAELERQVAELQLTRSVKFIGQIDNARLWQYYVAADLFVLPSRLESWGSVSIEALACGTPVVASNTAGSMEVQSFFPHDMTLYDGRNPLCVRRCNPLWRVVRRVRARRPRGPLKRASDRQFAPPHITKSMNKHFGRHSTVARIGSSSRFFQGREVVLLNVRKLS